MKSRSDRRKSGSRKRSSVHHGRKYGGNFLDGPAYVSAAYGNAPQQMDYITKTTFGPANSMSSTLPVVRPACSMSGGKKHRKMTHRTTRSSKKKSAKKHRKGKKRGGKMTAGIETSRIHLV